MNGNVTRVNSDAAVEGDLTDWERLRSLTEAAIEAAILHDPDTFPAEEADLARSKGVIHRYQIFSDVGGRWRWALRSIGGEVLAVGGESYASRDEVLQSIEEVRRALKGTGSEAA